MNLLPSGLRILIISGLLILSSMGCLITDADYSVSTLINTTGPVRDSFSGVFLQSDGNYTGAKGVYSDLVMTNDGTFVMTKHVSMTGGAMSGAFDTQKILEYSSGQTGGHLLADEYILTSTAGPSNDTARMICFGDPYAVNPAFSREHSASFSIVNAQSLALASASRSSNGTLEYDLNIGSPGSNTTDPGLTGTVITAFIGKTITPGSEVTLYDRTLISGLIKTLSRWYKGGETLELTAASSESGPIHDKTIMEQRISQNDTVSGESFHETRVYTQDIMTSGGRTDETRQVTGSESIIAERLVDFTSDGDRSIRASEHAVATRISGEKDDTDSPACVLGGKVQSAEEKSPYKEASAETGVAGVSSAKITSSTNIGGNQNADGLNLEYRANIMIPAGFNESLIQGMRDNDDDGRFEDLNGNGRLDMHDLVLLFQNFRWIGESNLSSRIDFNNNGRADFADIVTLFDYLNKSQSKDNI